MAGIGEVRMGGGFNVMLGERLGPSANTATARTVNTRPTAQTSLFFMRRFCSMEVQATSLHSVRQNCGRPKPGRSPDQAAGGALDWITRLGERESPPAAHRRAFCSPACFLPRGAISPALSLRPSPSGRGAGPRLSVRPRKSRAHSPSVSVPMLRGR